LCAILVLAGGSATAQPVQSNLNLSLTVASDYRVHSLSQTAGGPSARVAVDYAHESGFFAGGFAANVDFDYESERRRPRDLQLDFYAGYSWQSRRWSMSFALSRYLYPDIEYDYDYTQANVGFGFRDKYFFNAAYADHWLGLRQRGYDYQFGLAQPLVANLELGIDIGQTRVSPFLGGHFTHWDVGVSKLFDHIALDLRYYDSTLASPTLLGEPGGDRWVVSLAYAISPRGR
jgi:uncharacterized protein (TIGR02001 family)